MLATGKIFPDLDNLRAVSLEVGIEVAKMAERMNIATQFPPKGMDWREWLKHNMWQPEYPHIVVKNL
jgi:malate dehydrogenase (oxaloacetate-decarboxylating)(NADP+)